MREMDSYILRYAAGMHWLVKADQQDSVYKAPFIINDVGAILWKGMKEGYEIQELSILLQNQYEIDAEVALSDAKLFIEQLIKWKIITGQC